MRTDGMEMDDVFDDSLNDVPETSRRPVVHAPADGPLCLSCRELDKTFFDVTCAGCQSLLYDDATTVSQLFAVLRQWVPHTQQNVLMIIQQVGMIDFEYAY